MQSLSFLVQLLIKDDGHEPMVGKPESTIFWPLSSLAALAHPHCVRLFPTAEVFSNPALLRRAFSMSLRYDHSCLMHNSLRTGTDLKIKDTQII